MNNVKLLHIKCCFFQIFNSTVALKNLKKCWPQEKVEMTPLHSAMHHYGEFKRYYERVPEEKIEMQVEIHRREEFKEKLLE